jgi:hypothetical protein
MEPAGARKPQRTASLQGNQLQIDVVVEFCALNATCEGTTDRGKVIVLAAPTIAFAKFESGSGSRGKLQNNVGKDGTKEYR